MLATVKGDVHDIGKNLVDIILTNNGYEVHNLGIKVSLAEMIEKALEIDADAIGMSGLLVKSTLIMRENLEELNASDLSHIPVLLGGAALTRSYVERDLRSVYDGRLFYGKDAFEGLVGDGPPRRGEAGRAPTTTRTGATSRRSPRCRRRSSAPTTPPSSSPTGRPTSPPTTRCFVPPFIGIEGGQGHRHRRDRRLHQRDGPVPQPVGLPAREGRDGEDEDDAAFKERIRPILRDELAKATAAGILVPQVVYGYFPATADGQDLVIWADESRDRGAHPVRLPPAAQGAVPLHRRLRAGRSSRPRSTTSRSTSSRWARAIAS